MTTTGSEIHYMQPILDFSIPIAGDRDKRTKGDAIQIGGDYSPGLATVRKPSEPRKWDKRTGYGFTGATVVYIGDDLPEFDVDVYIWTQPQKVDWDTFKKKWLSKPNRAPTIGAGKPTADQKAAAIAAEKLVDQSRIALANPKLSAADRQTQADQTQAALTQLQAMANAGNPVMFPPQPKALGIVHPSLASANITAVVVVDVVGPDEDDLGGFLWTIKFMKYQPPMPMLGRPDAVIPGAKLPSATPKDATEIAIQDTLDQIGKANDNLARGGK